MTQSADLAPGPAEAAAMMLRSHAGDLAPGPACGILTLVAHRRGKEVLRECLRNVIVDGAKEVQARLIGGDVANRSVTQFGVGTGTGAALASSTGLTTPLLFPLASVTYPAPGQVVFGFSLGIGDANGMAITEFGLFTAGGTMFARRLRGGPFFKDGETLLSGLWAIYY